MKTILAAVSTLLALVAIPAQAQMIGVEAGVGVIQPRPYDYGRPNFREKVIIEEAPRVAPPRFHPNITGGGCPESFGKGSDGQCHRYNTDAAVLDQYVMPLSQICGGKHQERVRRPIGDGKVAVYDCP